MVGRLLFAVDFEGSAFKSEGQVQGKLTFGQATLGGSERPESDG